MRRVAVRRVCALLLASAVLATAGVDVAFVAPAGAAVGGAIAGRVRVEGAPRPGVTISVSGAGMASLATVTTDVAGQYRLEGLPLASDLRVEALAPPGASAGQVVQRVETTSEVATTLNIELRAADPPPAQVTTVDLPASSPVDVFGWFLRDPASGRLFVQKGGEVLALGSDGAVTGRIRGFGAARGIAAGDGSVFVSATDPGGVKVTRFDPATLIVTGDWTVSAEGGGTIAFAGHKLFILTGLSSTRRVQVLDLVTGSVADPGAPLLVNALVPVGRDTDRLVTWRDRHGLTVLDVRGPEPIVAASAPGYSGDVVADGPSDRLWTSDGVELALSTLEPTGVDLDGRGLPSFAPALGGIVTLWGSVFALSAPDRSHELGIYDYTVLSPSGDRAFRKTSIGNLSVHDLRPHVTDPLAWPVYTEGAAIALSGYGLGPTTSVEVDGLPVPFTTTSGSRVVARPPTMTPGPHEITVTTPWGTTEPRSFTAHVKPDPATVVDVRPATLPTSGGPVTITGTGFTLATRVDVGTTKVDAFTVVDDSTITFVAPPRVPGVVPVKVTNTVGAGPSGASITFVAPVPAVTSLAPSVGLSVGGGTVTVRGTGFDFATSVTFDGTPAVRYEVISSTQIRATYPAHAPGPAALLVTTAGGTSGSGPASTFTYHPNRIAAPATSHLSPSSGPTAGGIAVTLTGARFTGATSVRFGGTEATFSVVADNTIVATAPPGVPGTVNVIVTTPWGSDGATVATRFGYVAPPAVGSISGTVRDTAGPLANMVVLVSPAASPSVVTAVPTGPDGSFSVPSLPVGSYRLYVFDGRLIFGVPAERVGEWYQAGGPGTANFADSTPVSVGAGSDVVLEPIGVAATSPGSITGVVTDGSVPLAGIVVIVSPVANLEASALAVTGADGRFSIGGLAPGSYKVVAVHGAVLYGLPPSYATEFYDDVPDSPSAFASAPAVPVTAAAATAVRPIELTRL